MAYAIPTPHSATFFCARQNASHFSLSGAKKRQLQLKRYVQLPLNLILIKILQNYG
jgi:hypothetical protein